MGGRHRPYLERLPRTRNWALSDDPFVPEELNDEEVAVREKDFVTYLATRAKEAGTDWLAYSMLQRPAAPEV